MHEFMNLMQEFMNLWFHNTDVVYVSYMHVWLAGYVAT